MHQFFTDAGQYVVRFGDTSYGNEASGAPAQGEESALPADPRTLESAQKVGMRNYANRRCVVGYDCEVSIFEIFWSNNLNLLLPTLC